MNIGAIKYLGRRVSSILTAVPPLGADGGDEENQLRERNKILDQSCSETVKEVC